MRLVIGLGSSALRHRPDWLEPRRYGSDLAIAVVAAADAVAAFAEVGHDVVVTHDDGPHAARLAEYQVPGPTVPGWSLDVLGAETEAMIGYLLEQELANRLPGRDVATVITRVLVDRDDLPFAVPSAPIGSVYAERDARRLAALRGWTVAPRDGGWRRIVPAPEPKAIIEAATIRRLVDAGTVVVAGGGGVPVAVDEHGHVAGVEARVDSDLTAALLAEEIGADALVALTDVPAVAVDWDTPFQRSIATATPAQLRSMSFAAGSMAPKIEAACRFVEGTGRVAAIGSIGDITDILAGRNGTLVTPTGSLTYHPRRCAVALAMR